MANIRFPYGVSNFKTLVSEGYYYIDRTDYLEKLEKTDSPYQFFLRPRRFGKSLVVSIMEHYYGKQHRDDFQSLFGKYYIGQHPTPRANAYMVLKFDFSGIGTSTLQDITASFLATVKTGVQTMMGQYREVFDEKDISEIEVLENPARVIEKMLEIVASKPVREKIFLLIDEYDHFTNEIIAFHFASFQEIVSQNGFVRKFFEMVKKGTQSGIIDRIFITGISPVTLDSLTSGFNIGTTLSLNLNMHEFMGFTEAETAEVLRLAGVPEADMARTKEDVRSWYNGYLFHPEAAHRLYNPDMVLYFAMQYRESGKYPERLLDINVASDYSKIRRMMEASGREMGLTVQEEVLAKGWIRANLTYQFTFERTWIQDDLVSLLYYLGMLTVEGRAGVFWTFSIPNFVIRALFYEYFVETLRQRAELKETLYTEINDAIYALSMDNEPAPLMRIVEKILARLSGRDVQRFDESHLHTIFAALLTSSQAWLVRSQPETERRFVDILCTILPGVPVNWNFAFELKYLKKKDASSLQAKTEEAVSQLRAYLQTEDLRRIPHLAAYAVVFVGAEARGVVRVEG